MKRETKIPTVFSRAVRGEQKTVPRLTFRRSHPPNLPDEFAFMAPERFVVDGCSLCGTVEKASAGMTMTATFCKSGD